MHLLRWLFLHLRLYFGISIALVLVAVGLVAWQAERSVDDARELPLIKSLVGLESTIEDGTINSQAMGAAILSGLNNQEIKKSVLGKLPPDAPAALAALDAVRRQFITSAVFLVNAQGTVVASAGAYREALTGRDMSSVPYVQLAIQGTPNVYPSMGATQNDRAIFLAAPVRATENNRSQPIGVVVVEVGAEKLDMVLDSWANGIALLLSPQNEVFSAGHQYWTLHKPGGTSASRPVDANLAGQTGKTAGRPQVPFSMDAPETTIEGVRYATRSIPLEWHDPEGAWRLVVLETRPSWWAERSVLGLSGLTGLIIALGLFWLYTLARHEDALFKSDALLRESQRLAALGSYVLDFQTGRFEVSSEVYRLFGVTETYDHSIAGWLGLIHPDDRAMVEGYLDSRILEREESFNKEYRIVRHSDQTQRWVHGLGRLEFDTEGRPLRMHGSIQDITERKQAENALREEHNQNLHYLDTTLALMVELDSSGRITMINRAAQGLLGYAEDELLGRNWFDTCLPQPEGTEVMFPLFRKIMDSDIRSFAEFENLVLCRDGSQRLVVWRNSVLTAPDGKIVGTLSSGLDITESRRLAQQLETILEKSPTGVAVFRHDGACMMANEAYATLIGATHDEVLKQDFRNDATWRRIGMLDLANRALETNSTVRHDIQGTTAFGKRVALECIFAPLSLSGKSHFLLLVNDVLDRVEAQRALSESMHQLQQKELSKTRFLAAAGHDLRQPIAAANLFVDALKHSSPTQRQNALILRLEQSMGVFSNLLECLLDISKLDAGLIKPKFALFDLAAIFDWLDQNFSQLARAKNLRFDLFMRADKPLIVRTDIELLQSVVMNLVSNAIKFTSRGGILISARPRGDSVVLQVWDTGIGIAEANLPYIFDEFYQVFNPQRDREAGLGLGLASCQRRMSLLGGKVTCRSRLGRGSVFEVRLPLSGKDVDIGKPRDATPPPDAANETFVSGKRVVVVEDDKLVSDAMRSLLETLGAEVLLFNNAEQALQDDDISNADYFIVDYSLGGELSGLQFLESVQQKHRAKIRAVILTGETSSSFLSGVADSPWPVLNKPINIAALAAALKR